MRDARAAALAALCAHQPAREADRLRRLWARIEREGLGVDAIAAVLLRFRPALLIEAEERPLREVMRERLRLLKEARRAVDALLHNYRTSAAHGAGAELTRPLHGTIGALRRARRAIDRSAAALPAHLVGARNGRPPKPQLHAAAAALAALGLGDHRQRRLLEALAYRAPGLDDVMRVRACVAEYEAAELYGMSERQVRRARERGRLPYLKFGRSVRIPVDELISAEN